MQHRWETALRLCTTSAVLSLCGIALMLLLYPFFMKKIPNPAPVGLPPKPARAAARTCPGCSPRVSPAGSVGASQPAAERCPPDTRALARVAIRAGVPPVSIRAGVPPVSIRAGVPPVSIHVIVRSAHSALVRKLCDPRSLLFLDKYGFIVVSR